MARLILWNPSGANNTEQGKIKTQFPERKLAQCKDIDFACVVETRITTELNINSSFEDIAIKYRVSQKKYARLMSQNNASIASVLKIRLVSDK